MLPILQPDTAHVVWSFNTADPTDPLGKMAKYHNFTGSVSINLLSGLPEPPAEQDNLQSFDVAVTNVICNLQQINSVSRNSVSM